MRNMRLLDRRREVWKGKIHIYAVAAVENNAWKKEPLNKRARNVTQIICMYNIQRFS